ncbi:hypothetical protein GW915_07630 [bacterium]|nr:hypothetical protein [bacterium]
MWTRLISKALITVLMTASASTWAKEEAGPHFLFTAVNPKLAPPNGSEASLEIKQDINRASCSLIIRDAIVPGGSPDIVQRQSLSLYSTSLDPTYGFFNLENERYDSLSWTSKKIDRVAIYPAYLYLNSEKQLWLFIQIIETIKEPISMANPFGNKETVHKSSFSVRAAQGNTALVAGKVQTYQISCN